MNYIFFEEEFVDLKNFNKVILSLINILFLNKHNI